MDITTLSKDQWDSLLDGLVRGEYHLLLGAGASIGSLGGDGLPIPNATGLAEELLRDFGVPAGGGQISLRDAYEAIEERLDSKGRDKTKYLKERFSNCKPSWQGLLRNFRWRRIWTLNIDDTIEAAYAQNHSRSGQAARPYNWDALYSEVDRDQNELQISHLHGYAPTLSAEEPNLVFSIIEYLHATSARHAWHRIFGDEFLQRPFIVVGAKLADEYDLAEFLRRGNQSQSFVGRPSVIVLDRINDFDRNRFRRWGLVPVEAQADSFFRKLLDGLPSAELPLAAAIPGPPTRLVPTEALIFLQQFQWLRADAPSAATDDHDFYLGDDPTWSDIINSRDGRFEIVDRLLSYIREEAWGESAKPLTTVHCVWGAPGSGKTTVLLRIGRELISRGFDVFSFRGEERLDTTAALWWLQLSDRCALLFDSLADFAEDVGILAELCKKAGVNLVVFAAERERRVEQVRVDIDPQFLLAGEDHQMGFLSDTDISKLLDKLRSQRRLGRITRWSDHDQKRYFRHHAQRQLLPAMAELEGGSGFRNRLIHEYSHDISSGLLRDVYALCCISYALGYPLPLGIVCAAAGISPTDLTQAVSAGGQLSGILRAEPRGVKPRHRVVASSIVERALDKENRFRLTLALAKALAPYITVDTIRQRTLPYRIIRRLMDQGVVFDWVTRKHARQWYQNLVPEYKWDARFWEQRALAEARLRNFPEARSFAEEAVRIQRHPFTLNTLGTVLVRMAIEHHQPGSQASRAVLWEGISHLRQSRDSAEWRHVHPYTSFFTHVLRYAQLAYKEQPVERNLANECLQWIRAAEHSPAFADPENIKLLQKFQRDWLMLAV